NRSLIGIDVPFDLELREVSLIDFFPLALQVGAHGSSLVGAFIPIQFQPLQSFVNGLYGLRGIPLFVRVFNSENKFASSLGRGKAVGTRRAGAAHVKVASGRWSEASANCHFLIL